MFQEFGYKWREKKLESNKQEGKESLSFGYGLSDIQLKEENLIFMVHLAAQSIKPCRLHSAILSYN